MLNSDPTSACYFLLSHLGAFSRKTVRALSTPFLKRPPTSPTRSSLSLSHCNRLSALHLPVPNAKTENLWVLGVQSPRDVLSLPSVFFKLYARKVCPRSASLVASTVAELRIGCSAGICLFFLSTPMPNGYGLDRQFLSVERSWTCHIPNLHVSYCHLRSIHPEICRAPKTGCVRNSQQVQRKTMC